MKNLNYSPNLRHLSAGVIALLASCSSLQAQLTWDANDAGSGLTDGSGGWLDINHWWNGATNVDWVSGSDAIFGNGGTGGNVTLASPTTAGSLTFNTFGGTYKLGTSGQLLTLNSGLTMNAGSGNVQFLSPITLGAAQTWTNNSSSNLLTANGANLITNAGFALTVDGSGNTTFGVVNISAVTLSGSGALIKNGTGVLSLGGNNSAVFSGDVTLNDGILFYGDNPGSLGSGNLKITNGVLESRWNSGKTWTQGTGAGQIQITGGESGFSMNGGTNVTFNIGAITWGSTTFDPTKLLLQTARSQNNASVTLTSAIDFNGTDRTIVVNDGSSGTAKATLTGLLSNSAGTAAGFIKEGDGTLILKPADDGTGYTYDGDMKILGGTVQFGTKYQTTWHAESLPTTANLEINDGIAVGYWNFDARELGTGAGEVQITGGRAGFTFKQGDRPNLTFGNAATEVKWGSATFNPTTFVLNDIGGSATIDFHNKLDLDGANRTIETAVAGGGGTTNGDAWGRVLGAGAILTNDVRNSDVGNTAGLVKTGAGKLGLSGTNTYDGGTTVSEGGIFFDQTASMPGTGDVSLADGTEIIVTVGGTGWSTGTSGVGTIGGLLAGDGGQGTSTVSYSGAHTIGFNIDGTSQDYAGNIGDNISGTTSLKIYSNSNSGTMGLSGNNTYTGGTTLQSGTLGINSANAIGTGALTIIGGKLDNTSGSAVTLSTNNAIAVNNNFTFTGTNDLNLGTGAVTMNSNRTITVSANTLTVGGAIGQSSGNRNLTKSGSGTLQLDGINTYTGTTTVSAGTLAVNGSLGNGNTTVNSGATLQGSGSITGSVTVLNGGTLATGNSIESLATGALSLESGSIFAYEMDNDAAAGVAGDLTAVTGDLTLALDDTAILNLFELGDGSWAGDEVLTLISYSGTWNEGLFTYDGEIIADDSTINFSGTDWVFDYNATVAGSNYTDDLTGASYVTMTAAIPEPSTFALLGLGGLALILRRRR